MKLVWGRSIGWNLDFLSLKKEGMDYHIVEDGAGCYPWHEVYAWLPVKTVTGKIVWREKLFKRKVWVVWGTGFHMEPETQYATLFELLAYDNKSNRKN
jgi:hypothetical protein